MDGNFNTETDGAGLWQIDHAYDGTQDVSVKVGTTEKYKAGTITVNSADALENVLGLGLSAVVTSDIRPTRFFLTRRLL